MLIAVFVSLLILILPLIFSLYLYYDVNYKKLFFAVYLFGFFKIVSGYVSKRVKGGMYLHLTDTKAVIINFSAFKKLGDGPKIFRNISLISINSALDVGVKNVNTISAFYLTVTAIQSYSKIIDSYGYYKEIKTDLNVLPIDLGVKSIKIKIKLSLNIISILLSLITNYIIKGINDVKRKEIKLKRQFN